MQTSPAHVPTLSEARVERWKRWWDTGFKLMRFCGVSTDPDWCAKRFAKVLEDPVKVWYYDYPTLRQAEELYGEDTTKAIVSTLLGRFYRSAVSTKNLPSQSQMREQLSTVYAALRSYTVAEVLIFFAWLSRGTWEIYNGTCYEICRLIETKFKDLRRYYDDNAKNKKREERYAEEAKRASSYEEYKNTPYYKPRKN